VELIFELLGLKITLSPSHTPNPASPFLPVPKKEEKWAKEKGIKSNLLLPLSKSSLPSCSDLPPGRYKLMRTRFISTLPTLQRLVNQTSTGDINGTLQMKNSKLDCETQNLSFTFGK